MKSVPYELWRLAIWHGSSIRSLQELMTEVPAVSLIGPRAAGEDRRGPGRGPAPSVGVGLGIGPEERDSVIRCRSRRGAARPGRARACGRVAGAPPPSAIGLAFSIGSCGRDALTRRDEATATHPTFASDVAPLLYVNCVPCHHEGGPGPFPLIRYRDVSRRARQIVKVTGRRFMPPWPPVDGHGRFIGERGLTDAQIGLLARWVQDGAPEGDASATPSPPHFTSTWQLGTPISS